MPPTTLKQLQAQVELLAAVVNVLVAELPSEATLRVRSVLENFLQEQAPLSEDVDAAAARLTAVLLGPVAPIPATTCSVSRLGGAAPEATT